MLRCEVDELREFRVAAEDGLEQLSEQLSETRAKLAEAEATSEHRRLLYEQTVLGDDAHIVSSGGRLYMPAIDPAKLDTGIPRDVTGAPALRPIAVQLHRSNSIAAGRRPVMRARPLPTDSATGEMQGQVGTPWLGTVPGTEYNPRLHPYLARGLSTNIGELRKVMAHAVASDTVGAISDVLAGGSVYVRPPEVSETRTRWLSGYDADRLAEISEWLNIQLFLNPHLDWTRCFREMVWCHEVDGRSTHEFTVDTSADQWTLTGLELRELSSVMDWIYSTEHRQIVAFTQTISTGPQGMEGELGAPVVDLSRCVSVVNREVGLNPEGIATTRQMYLWAQGGGVIWETIQQHRRRFGYGFPVFRVDKDAQQDARTAASIAQARKFYARPDAYMQLPVGVDIEMLQFTPDVAGVEILKYCDMMIRRAAGFQHAELGIEGGGSYNLGSVSAQFFLRRMSSRVDAIASGMHQLIRTLVDARFGPQVIYPELAIDGILTMSSEQILSLWRSLTEIEAMGGLTLDERNRMRRDAELPPVDVTAEEEMEDEEPDELDEDVEEEPNEEDVEVEDDESDDMDEALVDADPMERHAHQHTGHTCRARRSDIVVYGRDGKPFTSWRSLQPGEEHVAWRSLADGLTSGGQSASIGIADILSNLRGEFYDAVADAIADGRLQDVAEAAERFNDQQSKRYVDDIASRLTDQLIAWSNIVEADMLDELTAMGGDPVPQDADVDIDDTIAALSAVKARQVVDEWIQQLTAAAIRGGQASDPAIVEAIPVNVDRLALQLRESFTTVMNQARYATVMQYGPEVVASRYSAVMDGDTCGQFGDGTRRCADMDGRVLLLSDPSYLETQPPNPFCDSALNLDRGNLCRCIEQFLSAEAYAALLAA